MRRIWNAAAMLALAVGGGGVLAAQDASLVQVRIERLRVAAVAADRVELTARCTIVSSVAARLGGVSFRDMRLDGWLPVFIAPQQPPLTLERNAAQALPPLQATVYMEDVSSVARLKAMLDKSAIRVEGEAVARLHLSLAGRLGLRNLHPVAMAILDEPAEMAPEAESSSLAAGLDVLSLAEHATRLVEDISPVEVVRVTDPRLLAAGVTVHTRYRLEQNGQSRTMEATWLGVRVGPHLLAVPDEAIEPWAYSPQVARKLERHDARVDTASLEISAKSLGESGEVWSLRNGTLTVLRRGRPEQEQFVLNAEGEQLSLPDRASTGNYALLKVKAEGPAAVIAPGAAMGDGDAEVLRPDGNGGADAESLGIAADGALSRPLPQEYFGSPVIGEVAVTGMIVAEGRALPVAGMVTADDRRRAEQP